MIAIFEAALEVEKFFRGRRWKFCIIGGLAVMRWVAPRATEDVDFSLLAGLGNERRIVARILRDFEPRGSDAAEFAFESRVLLIKASNGTDVDVALSAYPFEEEIIARASKFSFAKGVRLTTASAEDLVLMKAIADRPRDWQDVSEIVQVEADRFDWRYLDRQLAGLSEAVDVEPILQRLHNLRPPSPRTPRRPA